MTSLLIATLNIIGRDIIIILRFAIIALLTYNSTTYASSPVEEASRDIVSTYAFDPKVMSFDEQAKRAPELSELWGRFQKAPDSYRIALRTLLSKKGGTEMLYCDGGMLFLHKTTLQSDKALGLKSIAECSLAEIQYTPYFYTMHKEALEGTDVLDLQFRMLSKPKYQVFIPQHALTLGQDYSFLYPLLVQDEHRYVSRIIEKFGKEKNPTAQKTLLRALYYAATPETEEALHSIAIDKRLSPEIQKQAKVIFERIDEAREMDTAKVLDWMKRNMVDVSPSATEKDLRFARRKRMRAISDEALMELDMYTLLIYQAIKQ